MNFKALYLILAKHGIFCNIGLFKGIPKPQPPLFPHQKDTFYHRLAAFDFMLWRKMTSEKNDLMRSLEGFAGLLLFSLWRVFFFSSSSVLPIPSQYTKAIAWLQTPTNVGDPSTPWASFSVFICKKGFNSLPGNDNSDECQLLLSNQLAFNSFFFWLYK